MLLGATLATAGSAAADDVHECETTPEDAAELCIRDQTFGDDSACAEGGEGAYYGWTLVSVATETEAGSTDTAVEGVHACYDGEEEEEVVVSHDTCLFPEGWFCGQNADFYVFWDEDDRGTSIATKVDADEVDLKVQWSDKFGCDISVSSFNPEWTSERVDCPADQAPPGPAVNPGWGDVTP